MELALTWQDYESIPWGMRFVIWFAIGVMLGKLVMRRIN